MLLLAGRGVGVGRPVCPKSWACSTSPLTQNLMNLRSLFVARFASDESPVLLARLSSNQRSRTRPLGSLSSLGHPAMCAWVTHGPRASSFEPRVEAFTATRRSSCLDDGGRVHMLRRAFRPSSYHDCSCDRSRPPPHSATKPPLRGCSAELAQNLRRACAESAQSPRRDCRTKLRATRGLSPFARTLRSARTFVGRRRQDARETRTIQAVTRRTTAGNCWQLLALQSPESRVQSSACAG